MVGVKGGWLVGLVMMVAAVAMTRGERVVECEEEEMYEMQDNFVNCTQHFKQEYNIQVCGKSHKLWSCQFLLQLLLD